MARNRRRSWTADALCRLDSDCAPAASEEDRPFLQRFLLQEIVFAHSPYEGDLHNRPRLQGNLLCRSEWLHPRGISETESCILPVQELAAFPRCSACEQLKEEDPFSACRHLSAPLLHDEFYWQSDPRPCSGSLGRTDSACSERTDIIFDSEPDLWKQDLDVPGDRCPQGRSTEVRRCLRTVWDNCAGSSARLVCTVAQSGRSAAAGATSAGATLLSVNFALGTPSRTDDSLGIRTQRPAVRQPVSTFPRTCSQRPQENHWTTARFRTAPSETSSELIETSSCSPSSAGPRRWHSRGAWSLVAPRPGQKVWEES